MSSAIQGLAAQTVSVGSEAGAAAQSSFLALNNLCMTAGGYQRNLDSQEIQEMRNFVKRLKKEELQKINERFQPMLQAAGVPYEVQIWIKMSTLSCTEIHVVAKWIKMLPVESLSTTSIKNKASDFSDLLCSQQV